MPWFKVDDGFWSHPKTLQLSDGAVALWLRAGSWSMHHLTDGLIPDTALKMLDAKPRFVSELVAVSLWIRSDSVLDSEKSGKKSYQFHDWKTYQPTREQVEAERRAAADRKAKSRRESRRDSRVTDGGVTAGVTPTPTRPDPTTTSNEVVERPAKRGSRLSVDWQPSSESRAKIAADAPHVNPIAETETFRDYWIAQPGQKGVKTDWDATWRNWMRRKESDWDSRRTGKPTPTERMQQTLQLATDIDMKGISA